MTADHRVRQAPSPRGGTIWTVPAVNGQCVIMSRAHLRDGVAYFFALPLYPEQDSAAAHGELDFLFTPAETSLDESLYGAFWNARSIPASALGEQIGDVKSDQLLVELYLLRAKLDKEEPRHGRFGRRMELSSGVSNARSREVTRWTALSLGKSNVSQSAERSVEQHS